MILDSSLFITFSLYFVVLLGVGYLGYRATYTLSDYLLGGRHLGRFVTALSVGASDMSGWLLMGLPGVVYTSGLSQIWIVFGLIIGAWINWSVIATRLRIYTELFGNALTIPDYLANRFAVSTPYLRLVSGLIILIFFSLYCASGMVAGARLLESILGFSYSQALGLSVLATMIYVLLGGFFAVSWMDTIQGSLMISALLIMPVYILVNAGGIESSVAVLNHYCPTHLSLFHGSEGVAIFSLLAWGLGYFGQPHILVRFMAARSIEILPNARRISMTWMVLCLFGAVLIGLLGNVYFLNLANANTQIAHNPELIFILLSQLLVPHWLGGILLAAVLAAIMSTLSCQLLVCASALTQDFYKAFLRQHAPQKELIWVSRISVLLVTGIAIKLASAPESPILQMVAYAWAGFGASFGPMILLSLFWSRMTDKGALAGMVSGAIIVLSWKHFSFLGLYELIPGFMVSTLSIIVFSILDKKPKEAVIHKLHNALVHLRRK